MQTKVLCPKPGSLHPAGEAVLPSLEPSWLSPWGEQAYVTRWTQDRCLRWGTRDCVEKKVEPDAENRPEMRTTGLGGRGEPSKGRQGSPSEADALGCVAPGGPPDDPKSTEPALARLAPPPPRQSTRSTAEVDRILQLFWRTGPKGNRTKKKIKKF